MLACLVWSYLSNDVSMTFEFSSTPENWEVKAVGSIMELQMLLAQVSHLLLCFVLSIHSHHDECFTLIKAQGHLLFSKLLLSFVLESVFLFLVGESLY